MGSRLRGSDVGVKGERGSGGSRTTPTGWSVRGCAVWESGLMRQKILRCAQNCSTPPPDCFAALAMTGEGGRGYRFGEGMARRETWRGTD